MAEQSTRARRVRVCRVAVPPQDRTNDAKPTVFGLRCEKRRAPNRKGPVNLFRKPLIRCFVSGLRCLQKHPLPTDCFSVGSSMERASMRQTAVVSFCFAKLLMLSSRVTSCCDRQTHLQQGRLAGCRLDLIFHTSVAVAIIEASPCAASPQRSGRVFVRLHTNKDGWSPLE